MGASKVLLLFTKKGNPSVLFLFSSSGDLLRFLTISGVKLSVDIKTPRKEIEERVRAVKSYCIAESDCPHVSEFFVTLGYTLGEDCDLVATAKLEDGMCVVRFYYKNSLIIPPEIRVLNDKGNVEIYKWGVSLISEVVKG